NRFATRSITMKPTSIILILVFALLLSACGGTSAPQSSVPESGGVAVPPPAAPAADNRALEQAPADGSQTSAGGSQTSAGAAPADQQGIDRLVIKTADLSLEVENVHDAETAIRT